MDKKDKYLDWSFIKKEINNSINKDERIVFNEWLESSLEHQKLYTNALKYYKEINLLPYDKNKVDKAWLKQKTRLNKKSRRINWIRYAAMVLLLISVSVFLKLQSLEKPNPIQVSIIKHGSSKAVLKLSNGKIINLLDFKNNNNKLSGISYDSSKISYAKQYNLDTLKYNTLIVPKGGEYTIVLNDGTKVKLNSMSELRYPIKFLGDQRKVTLKGEAYFDVAKDTSKPFIVETNQMKLKVLGTKFNINSYRDEKNIVTTLLSGKVEIANMKDSNKIYLQPNQQAILNRDKGEIKVQTVNPKLYVGWVNNSFVFNNYTLKEIMRILSRWYNIDYIFVNLNARDIRFYGTLNRFKDIKELLNKFEKTGNVRFEYQNNNILIY